MRRSDVQRSYHQEHRGRPMVNVKVGGHWALGKVAAQHPAEFDDALFPAWLAANETDDDLTQAAWDSAIEQGWDSLEEDAHSIFGGYVKVWSAGRQGGWCVVDKLPDVDTWDAVMLGKWARFAKWARAQADDVPYLMVDYLYNVPFQSYRAGVDAKMAQAARDAGVPHA